MVKFLKNVVYGNSFYTRFFFQIFQSNVIMFKYVVTWVRKIGFDVISGKQGPTP